MVINRRASQWQSFFRYFYVCQSIINMNKYLAIQWAWHEGGKYDNTTCMSRCVVICVLRGRTNRSVASKTCGRNVNWSNIKICGITLISFWDIYRSSIVKQKMARGIAIKIYCKTTPWISHKHLTNGPTSDVCRRDWCDCNLPDAVTKIVWAQNDDLHTSAYSNIVTESKLRRLKILIQDKN